MTLRQDFERLLTVALLAFLLTPGPALADAPRGLPEGWTLGEIPPAVDGQSRAADQEPTPRTGIYLHGGSGVIEDAPGWDRTSPQEACFARTGKYIGYSMLPASEYWYYEADGEGLLLLRSREFSGYDADCNDVIRITDSFERVRIDKDGFTRFKPNNLGWIVEPHTFAAYRRTDTHDVGIGNAFEPLTYFVMRKRRLRESNVGPLIRGFQTHCIGYSSPPDAGGVLCWLAEKGPGRGILTYDSLTIAGGPNVYHEVSEIENWALLDGRLFEWDRPITGQ